MSRRGNYIGGHTVIRPGSSLLSGPKGEAKVTREQRLAVGLKKEAKSRLQQREIESGLKLSSAAIPGERERDKKRVQELRLRAKAERSKHQRPKKRRRKK